jgi:hypothetical protein
MDLLEAHFNRAKLACVVTSEPIERARRGDVAVVQMDIAKDERGETFRIYRGAAGNRLIATSVDACERQVLLMVHEPRRRFEATISKLQPVPPRTRVVHEDKRVRVIEQFTSERKRHFLCGMDESHLFIAQLPRPAPTVAEAHRVLRPADLRDEERRQGEWFFAEPSATDAADIALHARALTRTKTGIAQAARLPRAGRPHVADEVLVIEGRIFVRGSIRHPDHRTVRFHHWMRAIPNTEAFEQPEGVRWVD